MDTDSIGLIALLLMGGGMLIAATLSRWKNRSRNVVASPDAESTTRRS